MKVFLIKVDVPKNSELSCDDIIRFLEDGMIDSGVFIPPNMKCEELCSHQSIEEQEIDPQIQKRVDELVDSVEKFLKKNLPQMIHIPYDLRGDKNDEWGKSM